MWKFLFSPYGRVSRKTYWLNFVLPYLGVSLLAAIIDLAIGFKDPQSGEPVPVVGALAALFFLWPSLAVTTKRLHDRGWSGWWQAFPLLIVLPAAGAYAYMSGGGQQADASGAMQIILAVIALGMVVFMLYLTVMILFLRGQAGPNKYGDDPLTAA